jgi:tRNA(fMet)-specific endonuclease VapC
MKPILIDTNAYVALKRGDVETMAILRESSTIAINAIVLGELQAGFRLGVKEEINRRELARFLDMPGVVVLPLDLGTADAYAAVYAALKQAATPIPTNDMWIAASALQHDMAVFSFDKHFRNVPGLQTIASVAELAKL